MKIMFGMQLDGAIWSKKPASIGELRTGPSGLLNILETRLGTGKQSVHPAHRIDAYLQRIKRADKETGWFHESFSTDPWSTALQLLEWRDELVEAGWEGQSIPPSSPRLEALAELETSDPPLPDGWSDRLREVAKHLKTGIRVNVESITLIEPPTMIPPAWQNIFDLLKSQGISIIQHAIPDQKQPDSNLAKVQSIFVGKSLQGTLSNDDDSLILLKADNEWEAADQLALWLASKSEANDQLSIICGMDTSVLDQALKRHGLPRLGRTKLSRWQEIRQILPLTLANAWHPVDIRLVVELLSLTVSVFPKRVCRAILEAIAEEPGTGGRAWNDALARIEQEHQKALEEKGDSGAAEKAAILIRSIQKLLVNERFDPVKGIPEDKLRERCQFLIESIAWQTGDIPVLTEVIDQARDMQKLSIGKGHIPRITLERMLDAIIVPMKTPFNACEEAAHWLIADHSSQVTDDCSEIIWWGFNAPAPAPETYWSQDERAALAECGIFLEDPKSIRSRESYGWLQGLLHAGKRFMAIYISNVDGEEAEHHPFWDTIWSAASVMQGDIPDESVTACICRECGDFAHTGDWQFAGRMSSLQQVQKSAPPPVQGSYTIPDLTITGIENLSYSQMNTLIGCPFKWTLEYRAKLKLPESQSVPTGNQMLGSFCHRIIEELYSKTSHLDAEDAFVKAGALYDSLITSMASELLLEGNAGERQRFKTSITEAVRQLVATINRLQLTVEKTEALLEGTINGIPFKGYADMLLMDSVGNRFVLDMKWSSSTKYKRKAIEEGTALQLAAYSWMLRSEHPSIKVHTGYFMLAQGQLLSSSPILADSAVKTTFDDKLVWEMGIASLASVLGKLESGVVEARGIIEKEKAQESGITEDKASEDIKEDCRKQGLLYQSPPCRFCKFSWLCGKQGVLS